MLTSGCLMHASGHRGVEDMFFRRVTMVSPVAGNGSISALFSPLRIRLAGLAMDRREDVFEPFCQVDDFFPRGYQDAVLYMTSKIRPVFSAFRPTEKRGLRCV